MIQYEDIYFHLNCYMFSPLYWDHITVGLVHHNPSCIFQNLNWIKKCSQEKFQVKENKEHWCMQWSNLLIANKLKTKLWLLSSINPSFLSLNYNDFEYIYNIFFVDWKQIKIVIIMMEKLIKVMWNELKVEEAKLAS